MARHRESIHAGRRGGITRPLCIVALGAALALASFLIAVPALAQPGLVAGTPCSVTAEACVDLKRQQAWLLKGGLVTHGPVPISSGAPGHETPVDTFKVQWKNQDHVNEAGVAMPFAVFFAPGGIAFHEGDLSRASLGCVRLNRADAIVFFDQLKPGAQVQVH